MLHHMKNQTVHTNEDFSIHLFTEVREEKIKGFIHHPDNVVEFPQEFMPEGYAQRRKTQFRQISFFLLSKGRKRR